MKNISNILLSAFGTYKGWRLKSALASLDAMSDTSFQSFVSPTQFCVEKYSQDVANLLSSLENSLNQQLQRID